MALRAGAGAILVQPTGDNDETERGGLLVVQNASPEMKIHRGVVLHVGAGIHSDVAQGHLAHYNGYYEIPRGESKLHIVPQINLIAYEDDE